MRALLPALLAPTLAVGLAACPSPKMPTGPAPEYEDPPPPSWLDGGADGAAPAPASSDAGAI